MYTQDRLLLMMALESMAYTAPLGICQYIRHHPDLYYTAKSAFFGVCRRYFKTWPEYSGEPDYPIPVQSDQHVPHPRDAYRSPSPLYHEARNRLRLHLLRCLAEEQNTIDDVARNQVNPSRSFFWPNPPRPEIRITATELRQQEALHDIYVRRTLFDTPVSIPALTQGDDSEEHF